MLLQVEENHHREKVSCLAQNGAESEAQVRWDPAGRPNPAPQATTLTLEVRSKPRVSISRAGPGGPVQEGDRLELHCDATGNPSNMAVSWWVGGERVEAGQSSLWRAAGPSLTLARLGRELQAVTVECRARNAVGQAAATYTINVGCE